MAERGIEPGWVNDWRAGWLREVGASDDTEIVAWAKIGRAGSELAEYTRSLRPRVVDGVAHWLWTTARPMNSLLNFWIVLDGKVKPASTRTDLGWSEEASRPLSPEVLLQVVQRAIVEQVAFEELGRQVGRPILQGAPAIGAGYFDTEAERKFITVPEFRIIEVTRRTPDDLVDPAPERQAVAGARAERDAQQGS
jgi:hypothetical protein